MSNQPIDRGWSWVICFASFLCLFMAGLSLQVLSVLFLEFVVEFQSSVTTTSLSVMMFVMSLSVSSVVSTNILVPMFDERRVVVASAIVFTLCAALLSVAPNIVVFICLTAGQGTCMGCIYVPTISLTTMYFNKWRSIAVTISNSGISLALILGPPLIRYIVSIYGLRGTLLIMAGIETHMIIGGLLMRPVSLYNKASAPEKKESPTVAEDLEKIGLMENNATATPTDQDLYEKAERSANYIAGTHELTVDDQENKEKEATTVNGRAHGDEERTLLQDDAAQEEFLSHSQGDHPIDAATSAIDTVQERLPEEDDTGPSKLTRSKLGSAWSVTSSVDAVAVGLGLQDGEEERKNELRRRKKSAQKEVMTNGKDTRGNDEQTGCCSGRGCQMIKTIFDPKLFRPWTFRLLLIFAFPATTQQYLLQYIPTISVMQGATKEQGALLLAITGAVDLVSRISVGLFADTKLLKPSQIIGISHMCLGILCQFGGLFTSFSSLVGWAVVMGLFIGTRQSLLPVFLIECVGMGTMARTFSLFAMVGTFCAATHSPLMSALFEATGTFTAVLHFVGVCQILTGISLMFMVCLRNIDLKREEKQAAELQQAQA